MARKNIKLPENEYEKHNEQRKEMGLTWSEYIDNQSPELESTIRRVVRSELERFNGEQSQKTATVTQERADRIVDLLKAKQSEESSEFAVSELELREQFEDILAIQLRRAMESVEDQHEEVSLETRSSDGNALNYLVVDPEEQSDNPGEW